MKFPFAIAIVMTGSVVVGCQSHQTMEQVPPPPVAEEVAFLPKQQEAGANQKIEVESEVQFVSPPASVEAVAPIAVQAGPQTHVIQKDDTLYSLASRFYGKGTLWPKIKAANPGINPNRLIVGQEIIIPN